MSNNWSSDKATARLLGDGVMADERLDPSILMAFDMFISESNGHVPLRIVNNEW